MGRMLEVYIIAVIGFISTLSGVAAFIQAGGAGLAALFSGGSSVASTLYRFPEGTQGITIAYWAKPSLMQNDDTVMTTLSLNSLSAKHGYISYISLGHRTRSPGTLFSTLDGARIFKACDDNSHENCSSSEETGWSHHIFTWNASTGQVAAYENGVSVPLKIMGKHVSVLVRLFSVSKEPKVQDCEHTTGGYVREDTSCKFPFTFNGRRYTSCAPWSATPFIGGAGPRPTRNLGFTRGLRWCATVSSYSRTETGSQRKWGFCSCEDPELASVDRDILLRRAPARAWFSGPIPTASFDRLNIEILEDCSEISSTQSYDGRVVVVKSPTGQGCDYYDVSYRLQNLGASVIIFILQTPSVLTSRNVTSRTPMTRINEIRWNPEYQETTHTCSSLHLLRDGDVTTQISGRCDMEIVTVRGPPFASHYAFVLGPEISITSLQWQVYVRTGTQGVWRLVDRRSGRGLPGSPNTYSQYWFAFPNGLGFSAHIPVHLRFTFSALGNEASSCPDSFTLSELLLANMPRSMLMLPEFSPGPITNSSYFFYRKRIGGSLDHSSQPTLSPLVIGIAENDAEVVSRLGLVDIEFFPSIEGPRDVFQGPSTLVIGQSVSSIGTLDYTKAFTGLLDDIRIYAYQVSKNQALSLFSESDNYEVSANEPELNPLMRSEVNGTTMAPDAIHFMSDLPLSLYSMDLASGEDSGQSRQHLVLGRAPLLTLDDSTLRMRFGGASTLSELREARGPTAFLPSGVERVLRGDIVVVLTGDSVRIPLFGNDFRKDTTILDVSIVEQPIQGAISEIIHEDSGQIVASVLYTARNRRIWRGDEFTYQTVPRQSALTATGRVRIIPSANVEVEEGSKRIFVDAQGEAILHIGGAFSSTGELLRVRIDLTKVSEGSFSLVDSCTPIDPALVTFPPGVVALRYAGPRRPTRITEVVTWQYVNSTGTVVSNDLGIVTLETSPERLLKPFTSTLRDFDQRSLVKDGQMLVLEVKGKSAPWSEPAIGFQLVEPPRFGHVYVYHGPLAAGVIASSEIASEDIGIELVAPNPTPQLRSISVSEVVRTSSRYGAAESYGARAKCTSAMNECESWSSSSDSRNNYDLENIIGEVDGKAMRFGHLRSGHEFLELRFSVALVAQSITIRMRRAGIGALMRVSVPNSSKPRSSEDDLDCDRSDWSQQTSNYSYSWPWRACRDSSAILQPMPTSECATADWESIWNIALHDPCSNERNFVMPEDDMVWTDYEIPVCSMDVPISVVRLDFDTRRSFGWVEIDAVVLSGIAAEEKPSTIAFLNGGGDDVTLKLVFEPTPGITGQERISYRTVAMDCAESEIMALRFNIQSDAIFSVGSIIAVTPADGEFAFDYPIDVSLALNHLALAVHGLSSYTSARSLWRPSARMSIYVVFPATKYEPGLPSYVMEDVSPLSPLNASLVQFHRSGLDATVLLDGDVPVYARLMVSNYSDTDPSATVDFSYSYILSGNCGQASRELGACSALGRPYLNGGCQNRNGRYGCVCKEAADTSTDIVVAGDFCQYDSISTCFGRGYPDANGVCTCFQPDFYGGDRCNKRKNSTTIEGLRAEVNATMQRYRFALNVLEVTELAIVETSSAMKLVGEFMEEPYTLMTLDLTQEFSDDNHCHGNGIPLKGPLDRADCNCDEGWFPRRSCKTKLICSIGEYKAGEAEQAVCTPCPVGYACDGVDRRLCGNSTFTLVERSSRCAATCTEAGIVNAYVVRSSETEVQCLPCQDGYYCDGITSQLCPVGTFWTRSKVCIDCNDLGLEYYNDVPGAMLQCKHCPGGTSRIPGSPGKSIQECVCIPGYWNANPVNYTVSGVPCVPCPENGVCEGYEVVEDSDRVHGRFLQQSSNGVNASNTTITRNARPYPMPGFWGDPDYPAEFFECEDSCEGGKNFSCNEGYEGRLCQRCQSGYHDINGFCYECPGGSNNNALVFFGITGIVLAFVVLNRASAEVQALDIALLYAQVANLVQQFSFYFPPPVSALENYYAITDFDIDFITADCARSSGYWTFTDSFFAQWFLVWYVGFAILMLNGCAKAYSLWRERKRLLAIEVEKQVDLHAQRRRAAKAAARQAALRNELRRKQTGEQDFDAHEPKSGQGPSLIAESERAESRGLFGGDNGLVHESLRFDGLSSRHQDEITPSRFGVCCKRCSRCYRRGAEDSNNNSRYHLRFDDEDSSDPRLKAVARWIRRTLGFPKDQDDYITYTNSQLAGWINLVRVVYNSVILVCLQSFFCISLADGTSVLRAYPDLECGTSEHSLIVAFGVIGMLIYGVGCPAFVYAILTRGASRNLKANKDFYERFGILYVGYRQSLYRWEIMVLLRRLAMCIILVCAEDQPYIQAIFGGTVIVACLAAQLYHRPYLSDRINVLESIALASIFFYLLCGLVFTGLNDLYYSRQTSESTQKFIDEFSSTLSYILLVVSILTIVVCVLVFIQDLRDYFNVLVTERSLFHKAKSEDVALVRVLRADELKVPKADRDLGKELLERAAGRKQTTGRPDLKKQQFRQRRRSSLSLSLTGITSRFGEKQRGGLFGNIDRDGNNVISREELLQYARDELGLDDNEDTRARIERIFRMYDVDVSGSVDVREFMDMVKSAMAAADECELKNTIKPKYLIRWAASKQVTPLSVALFFELDKNMRVAVADDSIVSAYRDTSQAKFYRAVADAFPFLADWLASARQEDVKAFGKILEELNQCRDMVGPRGTFSRITVEIDRAPVIWWLVHAKQEDRATFSKVYGSICEASSQRVTDFPIWRRIKTGSSVRDAALEHEESARRPRRASLAGMMDSPFVTKGALPDMPPVRSSSTTPTPTSEMNPKVKFEAPNAQIKQVQDGGEHNGITPKKHGTSSFGRRHLTAEEILGNSPAPQMPHHLDEYLIQDKAPQTTSHEEDERSRSSYANASTDDPSRPSGASARRSPSPSSASAQTGAQSGAADTENSKNSPSEESSDNIDPKPKDVVDLV